MLRRHAHRMVMVVTMMVQRSHYPVIVGQLAFSSQLLSIWARRQIEALKGAL